MAAAANAFTWENGGKKNGSAGVKTTMDPADGKPVTFKEEVTVKRS